MTFTMPRSWRTERPSDCAASSERRSRFSFGISQSSGRMGNSTHGQNWCSCDQVRLLRLPASQRMTLPACASSSRSEARPRATQKALTAIPARIRRFCCNRPPL